MRDISFVLAAAVPEFAGKSFEAKRLPRRRIYGVSLVAVTAWQQHRSA